MKFWHWWVLAIFIGSGPWYGVLRSPQWARVTWVPFTSVDDKPSDMLVNTLMFLPLGFALKRERRGPRGTATVLLTTVAVSFGAESMQLYCRSRDPSTTDMVMNAVGTVLGMAAASLWRRRPLP